MHVRPIECPTSLIPRLYGLLKWNDFLRLPAFKNFRRLLAGIALSAPHKH